MHLEEPETPKPQLYPTSFSKDTYEKESFIFKTERRSDCTKICTTTNQDSKAIANHSKTKDCGSSAPDI